MKRRGRSCALRGISSLRDAESDRQAAEFELLKEKLMNDAVAEVQKKLDAAKARMESAAALSARRRNVVSIVQACAEREATQEAKGIPGGVNVRLKFADDKFTAEAEDVGSGIIGTRAAPRSNVPLKTIEQTKEDSAARAAIQCVTHYIMGGMAEGKAINQCARDFMRADPNRYQDIKTAHNSVYRAVKEYQRKKATEAAG